MFGKPIQKLFQILGLTLSFTLIFAFLLIQNQPSTEGWYSTARGVGYFRGSFVATVFGWDRSFFPLNDLFWGMAFFLDGGPGQFLLLAIIQAALLTALMFGDQTRWKSGGALIFLALFLPGLTAPGPLPWGYLAISILFLRGRLPKPAMAVFLQLIWLLWAPFSWVFGLMQFIHPEYSRPARIASVALGGLALVFDCLYFRNVFSNFNKSIFNSLFLIDNIIFVYNLLFLLLIFGLVHFSNYLSSFRSGIWNVFFSLVRLALVGLCLADWFFVWQVISPAEPHPGIQIGSWPPKLSETWNEHEGFGFLAVSEMESKRQKPPVTKSTWIHAHALIEPNLERMVLVDKDPLEGTGLDTIWVGAPLARTAARELLEALNRHSEHWVSHLSGTVAVLNPRGNAGEEFTRFQATGQSTDPASEACLALAWFEARRDNSPVISKGTPGRNLWEVLSFAQNRIEKAIHRRKNEALALALRGEVVLIRFVLGMEKGDQKPFEESFRLGQICQYLRQSLALNPGDLKTRALLQEILVRQGALDSAVDLDPIKIKRRLGKENVNSLSEWRVLDLLNELAFYHPLSEGKSMARLREASRLGLKGLALDELSGTDPIIFGIPGFNLRLELMFALGYIQETKLFLAVMKNAGLGRDLGLLEWPNPKGRGITATWKFPALLWYEAMAEAILDSTDPASQKVNQLISELQSDRNRLGLRVRETLPTIVGALALPQNGWTPSGLVAWQQWENEQDLFALGIQLGQQIQFLEKIRKETLEKKQAARAP